MSQLGALISDHKLNNKGFCLYRWPKSTRLYFVSGKNSPKSKNCFVFFPFDKKNHSSIFLKKEIKLQYNSFSEFKFKLNDTKNDLGDSAFQSTDFSIYQTGFNAIKLAIQKGEIQKAVLSKKTIKTLDENFDLLSFVERIFNKHTKAFCYLFYHPNTGLWMGASPEIILQQKAENAETIALAGTKSDKSVPWTNKELVEHKIVSKFITDALEGLKIDYKIDAVKTVSAGNLFHLKQKISFLHPAENIPKLLSVLHPTPAIGGYPKTKAEKIINEAESHSREYYCGYIGEFNPNQTKLFVNLRCAKIYNNQIEFFTGGGITQDSILENEWNECNRKAMSLIQYL